MRRKIVSVLLVISFIAALTPSVAAPVDEWITGFVDEDLFFAAYLFEGVEMVYLQADESRIIGYYWFEGPIIQAGRYITEAYLEVRTPAIGATDLDASMTIYGKPSGTGGTPSYAENTDVLNGPYTTNYYNVNLSSFVGPGVLHNITVTKILREINQGFYFWDGHDIAFVTLSPDTHDEERSISSLEAGYPAKLYVHYGIPPTPPGVPGEAEYVDLYRNHTIWEVDNLGVNRTGEGTNVNWNLLNVTLLNEIDSGASLTENNATWITANTYAAQEVGCFYNDTGAATVETAFFRFKINVGAVNNVGVGTAPIPGTFGLSTSTPVGGGGLPYGANGDFAGLVCQVNDDDIRFRFNLRERSGLVDVNGGYSQWFTEATQGMLYVEVRLNTTGAANWISYDIYDDAEFTNSINYDEYTLTQATDPFRYAYIIESMGGATGGHSISNEFYTYLSMPVPDNSTWYIVDFNETVVDIIVDFDGNLTDVEDYIDLEVIGYPDPEDPDPPGWEESPISIHRFKLILFIMGMILFIGTPVYGFAAKPEAATWIVILFCMLSGVALLWSLQTM